MGVYIDREKLINNIKSMKEYTNEGLRRGEWKKAHKFGMEEIVVCSECNTYMIETPNGMKVPFVKCFSYCPKCGAKMEDN